jgi:hypothetical protein
MKFVNKLGVISLIVLMFSFMNIANALEQCHGKQVNSCNLSKTQTDCENSFRKDKDTNSLVFPSNCQWANNACSAKSQENRCQKDAIEKCSQSSDCKGWKTNGAVCIQGACQYPG